AARNVMSVTNRQRIPAHGADIRVVQPMNGRPSRNTRDDTGGHVMSTTGTILKALQAVLLVTVLTPATVWAGPASTRQPATQTQDQPANGEAKHINRGLILTPAEAASSSNAQRPVTIPAVEAPQVEIPALPPRPNETATGSATNNFSTAASPPATTTTAQSSSIVTMPAPTQPATDTSAPA